MTQAARVQTPSSTFDSAFGEEVDFRVSFFPVHPGVSAALPCLTYHKTGDTFIASASWDGGTPVEQNRSASSAHLSHSCKPSCPSSPNPESEAVNGLPSAPASCWPCRAAAVASRRQSWPWRPSNFSLKLRPWRCKVASAVRPLPVSSFFFVFIPVSLRTMYVCRASGTAERRGSVPWARLTAMMCFSLHLRSEHPARVAQAAPGFVSCSSTRTMAIPQIPPPADHSNVCNNRPQEGRLQVSSPPPGEEWMETSHFTRGPRHGPFHPAAAATRARISDTCLPSNGGTP